MPVAELRLYRAYTAASVVRNSVEAEYGLEEIDWSNDLVLRCLTKYSKITLLHYYTYATMSLYERRLFRKDIDDTDQLNAIVSEFDAYDIPVTPFTAHSSNDGFDFYDWFTENEASFETIWELVTDEVFQLLFRDRQFLLQFNKYVADYLRNGAVTLPTSALARNGYLRRDSYYPSWLRAGIFHRDQGRCVLCQTDLTSLFHTDSEIHFDHMVPLVAWGTNDPCNLQLLCESCNLAKSGTDAVTSALYVPFWNMDS